MKTYLHTYDLPENIKTTNSVAIDTETMGLNLHRDRLCLIQLTFNNEEVHLIHFPKPDFSKTHNLKQILLNEKITKIFHFARFDLAALQYNLKIVTKNVYCTKIASHLVRTFTNKHGLKDLCKDLLKIEISKEEQTSDWGNAQLKEEQLKYAANDVIHLHALKNALDSMLERENRTELAKASFEYLPFRAELDMLFGQNLDIMAYKLEGK